MSMRANRLTQSLRILAIAFFALSMILPPHPRAEDVPSPAGKVEYLPLEPHFIVNLQGIRRYLRINVELMISGHGHLEKMRTHTPALRHALLMLFSKYSREQLSTAEQREALRMEALQAVRQTLDQYANSDGLRDLFFTEFLIQ